MRDDDDGAVSGDAAQILADDRLTVGVKRARRLVEDQQLRIGDKRAGNGKPLLLAA